MRRATKGAIVFLAVMALPAIPAIAIDFNGIPEPEGPGTPGTVADGPVEHVANVPYTAGTDVEFATETISVCAPDGTCQNEGHDYAFAGRLGFPGVVVDITDPRNPAKVAELPCSMNQNDIQIWGDYIIQAADSTAGSCKRPDGTKTTATIGISDISDPRNPKLLGTLKEARGAHNATVHPTQPIIYISDSDLANTDGGGGQIHIWDFTDPANPVKVQSWSYFPQHSPHDITFNAAGTRAYAASISHTDIIDTTNPKAPSLISVIANEGISISHQADPTPDGGLLLVSDELGGGGATTPSPGGPVHVYNISNEARPVKIGTLAADTTGVNGVSTAHVFRINPDGYTMAIGWYQDGMHVLDFSAFAGVNAAGSGTNIGGQGADTGLGARTIASMKLPNANVWAAKMWQERHPGYVFANDRNRGLDVFYVSELGPGFLGVGSVRAGHPGNYAAGVGATRSDFEENCKLPPDTQGVDGWVTAIPASLSDGLHQIVAKPLNTNAENDLDLYFYDKTCALLGADEDAGAGETADIPENTASVMTVSYTPRPSVRFVLTAGEIPAF